MTRIRLGLMGFGRIGRQIFQLAEAADDVEIVAISDVGQADVLHHLLNKTLGPGHEVSLEGNYLKGTHGRARMLPADHPTEIPWDLFDVDFVIDATGKFRSPEELQPHLDNGAGRVIISTLPRSDVDRLVLYGVNHTDIQASDRMISAGSASTTGAALALSTIARTWEMNHASMTSVHAYTSDQRLQDYASSDYRRSRSGAENIIPNQSPALAGIQQVLPWLDGKFTCYALNVPVQYGSMLDLTLSLADEDVAIEDINGSFVKAATEQPELIEAVNDPIVSSDVKGSSRSLVVDLQGTLRAGKHTVKLLGWHETLGHAARIIDVARSYARLGRQ